MAGLTWFELDVDFHEDPKVKALVSRLRQPLADSYVSRLYAYCYKHAVDRFPPQSASDTIEDVTRWKGRRGVLFDALFAVEVLERDAGMIVVHGVKSRLGPHLAKKQADAERQRKHRDKVAASIGRNGGVTRDVTGDEERDVTRESRSNRDRDIDREATTPDQGGTNGQLVERPTSSLVAFLRETYPDIRDPWKSEAAWTKAYPRVDLLAEALKAHAWEVAQPSRAKKNHGAFLNRWFGNATPAPRPPTHGDLGAELRHWTQRLTADEKRRGLDELHALKALDPDLEDAPLGIASHPESKAYAAVTSLNEKYRAIAEARV